MQPKIIALADCNSFFVSCEKVFNPALEGKPVVVLSGNDACVVSRSPEAKAIGIKMQAMGTEVKRFVSSHGLHIFSSNPALYRDMSRRVMTTLSHFCPTVEVYSVDEAFLDLTGFSQHNRVEYGQQMRQSVKQWTGIPVSIGIAPTKTLAKIANHRAKADPASQGVVDLTTGQDWFAILSEVAVRSIWGVGSHTAEALQARGIKTALQLQQADQSWIKKRFGVILLRTVLELGGMSCLPVEPTSDPRQGMMVTRCFGRPVTELAEMREAIATHTSRLAEKLRQEGLATQVVYVSMRTNRFANTPQYEASQEIRLEAPTNLTDKLLPHTLEAASALFKEGFQYYKAGVSAPKLVEADEVQTNLFDAHSDEKSQRLMQAMDQINRKLGSGSIKYAAMGLKQDWGTRVGYPSKRYTTCWDELPIVRA
ncbi:Y-family DNA polymerase [Oscillatoria sp. FACHB-1407]|uniref:Y-family DNA polymerase n=1 Tax=Oscillatoria sp. FACHB-1407 TaxID=2692847 RepID=UPI0018EFB99A|nr:Y-family DNA polymerase [Oscillatoria sp. FACHB-1407]